MPVRAPFPHDRPGLHYRGKGLELVRQVTAAWGSVPTRSRVDTTSIPGKWDL